MKLHTNEVNTGHATVLRHLHGGWAVPGGGRIYTKPEARDLAAGIDGEMARRLQHQRLHGTKKPLPALTVSRRDVSHSKDAQRWVIAHA